MTRTKYGYAESSKLRATNWGGHIHNVVDEENILENGMLVELGDDIGDDARLVKVPTASSKVCLVLDAIVPYDQSTTEAQLEYYHYPHEEEGIGAQTRAYELFENDEFAIIDYLVTAPLAGEGEACVVGNYLVADDDKKYKEVAADGFEESEYGFAAIILEIVYRSNMTLYRVRVAKNS